MVESQRRVSQIDVGTTGGEWMFKQDEMLFGPLPARLLIEKLYAGELSRDTPVAPSDREGDFLRLAEVPFFSVHLAKAEARLRVKLDTDQFNSSERRGQARRTAVAAVLLAVTLAGGAGGAYYVVVERQRRLQREIDDIPITANPPEIALEASASADEVALPVPGGPAVAPHRARHAAGMAAGQAARGQTDDLATINFDKSSILAAESRQKAQLIPCIKQELNRTPGFRGDIRFTLAIGNDGKIAKLWMDDSQFKEGPLQECFTKTTSAWRFASYEGERATLSDSFRVGH